MDHVQTQLVVGFLVVVAWHVSSHMSRYFNGVLHLRAQAQHNIKPSSTLVAHDFSSAFPLLTGGAYIRKRQFVPRVIK